MIDLDPDRYDAEGPAYMAEWLEAHEKCDLERWKPPLAAPTHLACGYAIAAHRDGRCPDEHEARALWGDR